MPDVEERIRSRAIVHQKAWQLIRELNATDERLEATAIVEGDRRYTFRQLFRMWDEYAEVFSGLGITEANGSRVGIVANISLNTIVSLYALNMLGVSVSMMHSSEYLVERWMRNLIKAEGITDLVIPDAIARPDTIHSLMRNADSLGLRHVILMRNTKGVHGIPREARQLLKLNYRHLSQQPGVLAFDNLRHRYAATPIAYGSGVSDEAAVITHTSGTTKGTHKPIPLSDDAFNAAVVRLLDDNRFSSLRGGATSQLLIMPSFSFSLVDGIHLPLAYGCAVAVDHSRLGMMDPLGLNPEFLRDAGVNVLLTMPWAISTTMKHPDLDAFDFSGIKLVVFAGQSMSADELQRMQEFFAQHGGSPTIINGYGLSECGAAAMLSVYDGSYHGIGRALSGVTLRIFDDSDHSYHAPEEGPRTGVLYIASDSNTTGRIGDTTFFELDDIEGVPYVNTHDIVRVDESGDIYCLGRERSYYIENKHIKFNASKVEDALRSSSEIDECVLVPTYEKRFFHDTVPSLYVKMTSDKHRKKTLARVLRRVFVEEGLWEETGLPWRCVIVDNSLPHNEMGKISVAAMIADRPKGQEFAPSFVEREGSPVDVRLEPTGIQKMLLSDEELERMGVPKEVRDDHAEIERKYKALSDPRQAGTQMLEAFMRPQVAQPADLWLVLQDSLSRKKSKKKAKKKKKGKKVEEVASVGRGLAFPEPIDTAMRVAFAASEIDYTYEE